MSFFEELKRRNVFRVGIAYAIASWVLLQVADLVLENIGAPDWVIQSLMLVVALGFIAALAIAWAYELTPDGIKRESEVDRSISIVNHTGQKLDRIVIGFLVIAVLVLLYRQSGDEPAEMTVAEPPATKAVYPEVIATNVDRKSIAVLPFVNMSSDPEQEYFSDGITEEILNRLAKIPDLQVAARTSVFSFKGQNLDVREVAEMLGVGTMLEGSVRRDGEMVRITAQLIRASDGFHLWSESYDRKIESIFAVQDEISQQIAEALQVSLGIAGESESTATTDPEVFDLFLQGRALHRQRGAENLLNALDLFRSALDIDPEFAPAWAGLSHSLNVVTAYASREEIDELGDVDNQSLQAAQKALELDPKLATALHAMANNHLARFQWSKAETYYEQALAMDPESTDIMEDYGHFLLYSWRTEEARQVADRMISLDPYVPVFRYMAMRVYHTLGDVQRWGEHIEAASAISAELLNVQLQKFYYLLTRKDFAGAYEFAGELNLRGRMTPESFRSMVDWVANPSTEPTEIQMNALLFFSEGALVAGRYELWLDLVLGDENRSWEDVLVNLSHLSSFADKEQYVSLHADPRTKAWLQRSRLPDYWRTNGWPPRCRPLGVDDFVCE
jgi:TolB-like protein